MLHIFLFGRKAHIIWNQLPFVITHWSRPDGRKLSVLQFFTIVNTENAKIRHNCHNLDFMYQSLDPIWHYFTLPYLHYTLTFLLYTLMSITPPCCQNTTHCHSWWLCVPNENRSTILWTGERFDSKESSCKGSVRFSILCVRFSELCVQFWEWRYCFRKRVLAIEKNCKQSGVGPAPGRQRRHHVMLPSDTAYEFTSLFLHTHT